MGNGNQILSVEDTWPKKGNRNRRLEPGPSRARRVRNQRGERPIDVVRGHADDDGRTHLRRHSEVHQTRRRRAAATPLRLLAPVELDEKSICCGEKIPVCRDVVGGRRDSPREFRHEFRTLVIRKRLERVEQFSGCPRHAISVPRCVIFVNLRRSPRTKTSTPRHVRTGARRRQALQQPSQLRERCHADRQDEPNRPVSPCHRITLQNFRLGRRGRTHFVVCFRALTSSRLLRMVPPIHRRHAT